MPIGKLYGLAMSVRNRLYDRGLLRSHSLGARTVSIGNITTGGTGKTPLVALTAEILSESGETVCILTRGYGRIHPDRRVVVSDGKTVLADASTGGDEPVELAKKLLGRSAVVADADRIGASKWARTELAITAFVLDDAFQHRRAKRDLDVVCVDATNPWGKGGILPAGSLREPLHNIRRADAVVITRADLVDSPEPIIERLRELGVKAPIFRASTRITRLTVLQDFLRETPANTGVSLGSASRTLVFTGIGNPAGLRKQLAKERLSIAGFVTFRDHHRFSKQDICALEQRAKEHGAEAMLTTAKDAVKLAGFEFDLPVYVIEAETELDDLGGYRSLVLGR